MNIVRLRLSGVTPSVLLAELDRLPSSRLFDQPAHDILRLNAFGLRGKRRHQAMSKHRRGNLLDVFQAHHVAAQQRCTGFRAEN